MNDSKGQKAAFEPPLDCLVRQRVERYLRQLAPHQNEREGPTLMREALAEIERLQAELYVWRQMGQSLHDAGLRQVDAVTNK